MNEGIYILVLDKGIGMGIRLLIVGGRRLDRAGQACSIWVDEKRRMWKNILNLKVNFTFTRILAVCKTVTVNFGGDLGNVRKVLLANCDFVNIGPRSLLAWYRITRIVPLGQSLRTHSFF